jgi:hypothetical protein
MSTTIPTSRPLSFAQSPDRTALLQQIARAIEDVRYGQVQIIIQDSRVVQIDKTEKLRLV